MTQTKEQKILRSIADFTEAEPVKSEGGFMFYRSNTVRLCGDFTTFKVPLSDYPEQIEGHEFHDHPKTKEALFKELCRIFKVDV